LEELAGKRGVEIIKGLVQAQNVASRRLIESLGYEHRATLYAEFKSEKFGEIDDCVYYKRLVSRHGSKTSPPG
jgi:L-amino acid N-acyltransferase YncA